MSRLLRSASFTVQSTPMRRNGSVRGLVFNVLSYPYLWHNTSGHPDVLSRNAAEGLADDPIFTLPRLHRSTACSGPIEAIVFQMLRFEGNGKLAK